ncbi:MAG: class I SAM-dependent methyltransferase [Saprospiraceae bacterium]
MKKEWFETWFDSPYYHVLYQNHDEKEARTALNNLLQALHPAPGALILDQACGKGRYARYLAEQGYEVTGLDLSPHSIAYARQFEQENLTFFQHDMRRPFRSCYYDAVMNMFTSFGYFRHDREHRLVLRNVSNSLRPGGKFLLDYFNAHWVRQHLHPTGVKVVQGIEFHLTKWFDTGHVFKRIEFEAEGRHHCFQERVRLFTLDDFKELFTAAGLDIYQTYGDYRSGAYDPQNSTRLILIAEKARSA